MWFFLLKLTARDESRIEFLPKDVETFATNVTIPAAMKKWSNPG